MSNPLLSPPVLVAVATVVGEDFRSLDATPSLPPAPMMPVLLALLAPLWTAVTSNFAIGSALGYDLRKAEATTDVTCSRNSLRNSLEVLSSDAASCESFGWSLRTFA